MYAACALHPREGDIELSACKALRVDVCGVESHALGLVEGHGVGGGGGQPFRGCLFSVRSPIHNYIHKTLVEIR